MRDDQAPIPDPSALMRMATSYLARYAASSRRLRQVLERRIRRASTARGDEPPEAEALTAALDDVIARLQQLGLIDDRTVAEGRKRALQRKGLPPRRIHMVLRGEGLRIGEDEAEPDDPTQARRFAARKRLGPFRAGDRASFRDKDLRSLLRAGYSFAVAVATVDAEPEKT